MNLKAQADFPRCVLPTAREGCESKFFLELFFAASPKPLLQFVVFEFLVRSGCVGGLQAFRFIGSLAPRLLRTPRAREATWTRPS